MRSWEDQACWSLGQRAVLFQEHGGIWHGRKQKGGTALPQLLEKEEEGNQERVTPCP